MRVFICSFEEVSFVDDCGPQRWRVERTDSKETGGVLGWNMEIAISLGNNVGVDGGGGEVDGAGVLFGELDVIVKELLVASARYKGARVHKGSGCVDVVEFRDVVPIHVWEADGGANVNAHGVDVSVEHVVIGAVVGAGWRVVVVQVAG